MRVDSKASSQLVDLEEIVLAPTAASSPVIFVVIIIISS